MASVIMGSLSRKGKLWETQIFWFVSMLYISVPTFTIIEGMSCNSAKAQLFLSNDNTCSTAPFHLLEIFQLTPFRFSPGCSSLYVPPFLIVICVFSRLPDQWLPEKDVVSRKDVRLTHLSATAKDVLYSGFCSSYRDAKPSTRECSRQETTLMKPPATPANGICRAVNKRSANSLHCHNNNAKTDSLKTNTANKETSFDTFSPTRKRVVNCVNEGSGVKLTGAAKRKQGKRFTGDAALRL